MSVLVYVAYPLIVERDIYMHAPLVHAFENIHGYTGEQHSESCILSISKMRSSSQYAVDVVSTRHERTTAPFAQLLKRIAC